MKIIGCDLHAAQQTIAMLDPETGEIVEQTLKHEAGTVREFYAALPAPVVVGLEATGSMGGFCNCSTNSGSRTAWDIRRRSERQRLGSRNTIDEMPRCCYSC